MAGQPTKKGSWGDWAVIENKPNEKRISCSLCAFYCDDGSCCIHPIVISEVGFNYWRQCDSFLLNSERDTIEFRERVNHAKGTSSPYHPQNSNQLETLQRRSQNTGTPFASVPTRVNPHVNHVVQAKSDCRYSKYVLASDSFICTNSESLFWTKPCHHCSLYIREVFIVNHKQLSHAEYEQKKEKSCLVTRPTLPTVSTSKAVPKGKATSTPAKKKPSPKKEHIPTLKASSPKIATKQVKVKSSTHMKKEPVLVPNPKVGCRYLSGSECRITHNICTRGKDSCLFYKPE